MTDEYDYETLDEQLEVDPYQYEFDEEQFDEDKEEELTLEEAQMAESKHILYEKREKEDIAESEEPEELEDIGEPEELELNTGKDRSFFDLEMPQINTSIIPKDMDKEIVKEITELLHLRSLIDNNEYHSAFNIQYIINDTLTKFSNVKGTVIDRKIAAKMLNDFCDNELVTIFGDNIPLINKKIFNEALLPTKTIIRCHLASKKVVQKYKMSQEALKYTFNQIYEKMIRGVINPGEMVGVLSGSSLGQPTTQLSVVGNTMVFLKYDNKIKKIEIGKFCDNIINTFGAVEVNPLLPGSLETKLPHGIETLSVNKDGKVSWQSISHISRHPPNGGLVRVMTATGRVVTCTLAHSLLTCKDGKVVPIKACDVKLGDKIPILAKIEDKLLKSTRELNNQNDSYNISISSPLNHKIFDFVKQRYIDTSNLKEDIYWDTVHQLAYIRPKKEMVYDFTVPGYETFIVNQGIFVHNTLNTFHAAGVAEKSNVNNGMERVKQLLNITSTEKCKDSVYLTVRLKENDSGDLEKVKKIMAHFNMTYMNYFVKKYEVLDDINIWTQKKTIIPDDEKMFAIHFKYNKIPRGVSTISIRIILDMEMLFEKRMHINTIVNILQSKYPHFYIVSSGKDILRIFFYMDWKPDRENDEYTLAEKYINILETIELTGTPGIKGLEFTKHKGEYYLYTNGTNLRAFLSSNKIDPTKTKSNDIRETYSNLGIEAARQVLFNGLHSIYKDNGADVSPAHINLLVNTMTHMGILAPVNRSGLSINKNGIYQRSTFELPAKIYVDSAVYGATDNMRGTSANIMHSQGVKGGTTAFELLIKE